MARIGELLELLNTLILSIVDNIVTIEKAILINVLICLQDSQDKTEVFQLESQLEQNELAAKVFNENQKYFTGLFSLTQKSGRVKGVCTDFEGNISKEITDHFNSLFCV